MRDDSRSNKDDRYDGGSRDSTGETVEGETAAVDMIWLMCYYWFLQTSESHIPGDRERRIGG